MIDFGSNAGTTTALADDLALDLPWLVRQCLAIPAVACSKDTVDFDGQGVEGLSGYVV